MRAPDQSFTAAIDQYRRKGSLTDDDQCFLDRLRVDPITAKFKPSPGNARLLERIVAAWRVAKGMMKEPEAQRRLEEEAEEFRRHVQALRDRGIAVLTGDGPIQLAHGFAFIDERKPALSYAAIEAASDLPDDQPFPKLNRQPSEERLFIEMVSAAMQDIFGKPRDGKILSVSERGAGAPPRLSERASKASRENFVKKFIASHLKQLPDWS